MSCNPKSQAEDVEALCEGKLYRVTWVQPVDCVPQTPHIENICVLERGSGKPEGAVASTQTAKRKRQREAKQRMQELQ